MKESSLKKALIYQLNSIGWSSLYVYGITVAILIAIGLFAFISITDGDMFISIGGVGFFHFLVIGISGIREDLRFFLQHGIGRRTTYFSNLFGSLISSVAVGLFCVIFNLIGGQLLGFSQNGVSTFSSFVFSWISYSCIFFFAWQLGALISLIYYRLSKTQQIVFSVIAIAIVIFVFFNGIRYLIQNIDELEAIIRIEMGATWFLLLIGSLSAAGNYFLIRRAQIKD